MEKLKAAGLVLAIASGIDIIILIWTMLQIGNGIETPHIAFWDMQIRAILSIVK